MNHNSICHRIMICILCIIITTNLTAQTGVIKGRIYNRLNNEAIPFATVVIDSLQIGTISDTNGNYRIENVQPGTHNLSCSFVGFGKKQFYEIRVTPAKPTLLDIPMDEETTTLGEIKVTASPFNKTEESPVSLRTISATEIYRNPGGNRDISKVIQTLPGVASSAGFRNDIIVRGGAPNENRFFLDGIEVPNINHFATQGSSGGPVGMINVNFIREVEFYASAFPANRGNALSAVLELKQIEGNDEKLTSTVLVGSSDIGVTLDGPIGKKSTFIFSARHSYLQLLFQLLKLPFLPTYTDFQYKHTIKINPKNRVTLIGLGAIDDFKLNRSVNDGIDDQEKIKRNNYILGNLLLNTQWNYTIGAKWDHFTSNSYQTVVISRNHLNNNTIKYQNNIEEPQFLVLKYNSQEIENKLRIESNWQKKGWKWKAGIGYQNVLYTNSTYNKIEIKGRVDTIDFASKLILNKFSAFGHVSKSFLSKKLTLSLGIRTDFNDYANTMLNPIDQFSPRLAASYILNDKLNLNINLGRYVQLPAYTVMGYRDTNNILVNKNNNIKYIQADHIVAGVEYNPTSFSTITVEGFYKLYNNYPFLIRDSISLANLGGNFGVIGNEPAISSSSGESYGLELLAQQKLSSSIYGILSYTIVRSKFSDKNKKYIPSAWDNQHILNITAGKKFKRNWEAGLKFRLLGGAPYTPYNIGLSSQKAIWDIKGRGIRDWDRLNQKRAPISHGLDMRVDKKWFFKKWSLNLYIDIQNVYNFQLQGQPYLDVDRDASGNPITDPKNPMAYKLSSIENTSGTILPSIGLMIEF